MGYFCWFGRNLMAPRSIDQCSAVAAAQMMKGCAEWVCLFVHLSPITAEWILGVMAAVIVINQIPINALWLWWWWPILAILCRCSCSDLTELRTTKRQPPVLPCSCLYRMRLIEFYGVVIVLIGINVLVDSPGMKWMGVVWSWRGGASNETPDEHWYKVASFIVLPRYLCSI